MPVHPTPDAASEHANWRMAQHWPELVQAVTDQAIETVDLLSRGLELMLQRGKLSAAEFQVLATPAQRLKRCGIQAQQIVRFQSGQVRQSHEKVDLALIVDTILRERLDALALQGVSISNNCTPTQLQLDPTLGYSLVQTMLDWGLKLGQQLELNLDLSDEQPARARLSLRVQAAHTPPEAEVLRDSIHWLLLRQIAATDGAIELQRTVSADAAHLSAWFKRVLATPAQPPERVQPSADMLSTVFKTVSNAYVLVCSAAPELRRRALDIVRQLGVQANGVSSGAQATAAMRTREVHLLILDEGHPPSDMAQLHFDLAALHPDLAVLRLVLPRTQPQDRREDKGAAMAQKMHIPLDELETSLGSAVMFTLSNVL